MRMGVGLAVALALAGCGNLNLSNGQLPCSSDGRCPSGYYCACNDTCWQEGSVPPTDACRGDGGGGPDLRGTGGVDAGPDGGDGGLLPFTPATFWMCGGGGGGTADVYQLNFSVGGGLRGGGAGSGGDGISFGFMSTLEQ